MKFLCEKEIRDKVGEFSKDELVDTIVCLNSVMCLQSKAEAETQAQLMSMYPHKIGSFVVMFLLGFMFSQTHRQKDGE